MKLRIHSGRFIGYSSEKHPVFELEAERRNGPETIYSTVLDSGVTLLSKRPQQIIQPSLTSDVKRRRAM